MRFESKSSAVDWLRDHPQALVLGGIVVVAGVSFVVICVGAGLLVLAPLALL